ncbi:MAG TPA: LCP family protein [Candidatus Eisenbergiella intestinipullorum]|nr:LCP family protein [Candidatus Eisenbergiella intestinipullorum]
MRQTEKQRRGKTKRGHRGKEPITRRRKRRRSLIGKIGIALLVLLTTVLLLALLAAAAVLWMNAHGRSSLLKRQEERPDQMEQMAEEETSSGLPDGAIRYNGKAYLYKENILTFLCMGIDRKGEVEASEDLFQGGQADSLFLAVLDQDEKKISIIGINRDTMTEINVYDANGLYAGKEVAQIALAHAYGDGLEESCENTVEAVSNLFYGLPIHGYCALNMSVISTINDAVGGVDVTIPASLAGKGDGWTEGERVHLMGEDAYTFIHDRDTSVARSAEERLERQKQYLNAFVAQAKSAMRSDMTLPLKLYTQVTPYMVTDVTADEAVYLAGQALSYSFSPEDIYSMEGHVEMGDTFEEFYQDDTALYEMILEIFYEELPDA